MIALILILISLSSIAFSKGDRVIKEIYDIKAELKGIKTEIKGLNNRFDEFRYYIDKRFEAIDRRFEAVDKRFEDINSRFEDINRRFEDINKRFEDINKRFEQLYTFLWILAGVFTSFTLGVISFGLWDRKTIVRSAKQETLEELERDIKPERLRRVIEVLREYAQEDEKLRNILKKEGLL